METETIITLITSIGLLVGAITSLIAMFKAKTKQERAETTLSVIERLRLLMREVEKTGWTGAQKYEWVITKIENFMRAELQNFNENDIREQINSEMLISYEVNPRDKTDIKIDILANNIEQVSNDIEVIKNDN